MKKDPLGPIEFIVTVLTALVALIVLVAVPSTIFGSGSFLGLGDTQVCVTADTRQVPYALDLVVGGGDPPSEGIVSGVRSGVTASAQEIEVCREDAGSYEHFLGAVWIGASLVFVVGFLLLVRSVIARARRDGLFTLPVAGRLSALGWYLIVGLFAMCLARWYASYALLERWVDDASSQPYAFTATWSWAVFIGGFASLTIGRIMARAVSMQEELDATV